MQLWSASLFAFAVTTARGRRASWRAYYNGPLQRALPIGAALALANGAMMFALSHASISMFQTVKASGPLFTAFACHVFLNKRYSGETYATLVPIMVGLMMATLTDVEGDVVGFTACVVSSFAQVFINLSAKSIFETRWAGLASKEHPDPGVERTVDPFELQMLVSAVGAVVCSYGFLLLYFANAWTAASVAKAPDPLALSSSGAWQASVLALLVNVVLYCSENVCANAANALLTRLPFAVADATRRLSIVTMSSVVSGSQPTSVNIAGVLLVAAGAVRFAQVVREVT